MVVKKKDWNAEFELAKVKKWEKIEHIYYIVVLMGFLICMITFARFVDIAEEFAILIIVIGVLFLINWPILSLIVFRMKRDYIKNKKNKIHKTAGNVYDTFTELNLSSGRINVPNLEEVDPSDLIKEVLPEKREFVINEFITLKLEGGKTNIYVNGEYFRNCMFLMLNLNVCRIEQYDSIKSIDDAEDRLSNTLETFPAYKDLGITLEELFKGHCSNIQVWAENNYDTRILHRNLAFPLLKELTKSGDQQARKVFKEEIGRRFVEGNDKVRKFLSIEGYLNYLNVEENVLIFETVLKRDRKISMHIDLTMDEKERKLFSIVSQILILLLK